MVLSCSISACCVARSRSAVGQGSGADYLYTYLRTYYRDETKPTGWNNLALRGTWRPQGPKGEHVMDFGVQQDSYKYRYLTSNITGNWLADGAGTLASEVGGRTQLQSVYAQDTWRFAPKWRAVLGLRSENWTASQGLTDILGTTRYTQNYAARQENFLSPKAALSKQISENAFVKYAVGRAVRMPTVAELYGATSTSNSQYINDPNLRPEKSWTQELSYEKNLDKTQWRVTALFTRISIEPASETTRFTSSGFVTSHSAPLTV